MFEAINHATSALPVRGAFPQILSLPGLEVQATGQQIAKAPGIQLFSEGSGTSALDKICIASACAII